MPPRKKKTDEDEENEKPKRVWPRGVILCLEEMDIDLVKAGFPPISPWWWAQLREFYDSNRRQFVGRIGRRGGKSSTISRVGIAEILTERHKVPPGDTGIVSIVSVDRREAAKRIHTMDAILCALSIDHKTRADGIDLADRPYAISIHTSTVGGVSGFTCICAFGDEVSKWKDIDTGVNPAEQVLSSWRPTMATMPEARMFLLSSPWETNDAHSRAFDDGTNDRQQVAYAPTWVAHPALTREQLERDEPKPRIFQREYEAIPLLEAEDGDSITVAQIDRAIRAAEARIDGLTYVSVLGYCRESKRWLLLVATRRRGAGNEVRTSLAHIHEWPQATEPRVMLREAKAVMTSYGTPFAYVPETMPTIVARIAQRLEMVLVGAEVTNDMHASLRVRFADDGMEMIEASTLREDLLAVREGPNGKFVARGFAPLAALAANRANVGPEEKPIRPKYGTPDYWTELAAKEQERDFAEMRAQNERRAQVGDDWVDGVRKGFGFDS